MAKSVKAVRKIANKNEGRYSQFAGFLSIFIGAAVLFGWAFHIGALKTVFPGFVSMKANTAVGFIFLGPALLCLVKKQKLFSVIFAAAVALIGLLTFSEYVFGWKLGIDELIIKEDVGAALTAVPGRMAIVTAVNFFLLGAGLLLAAFGKKKISDGLILFSLLGGILSAFGYLFDVKEFYKLGGVQITAMALHTSLLFIIVSFGVLFVEVKRGLLAIAAGKGAVAHSLRQAVLWVAAVIIFFGWLGYVGRETFNFYGKGFEYALQTTLVLVVSTVILFLSAKATLIEENKKNEAEAAASREREAYGISLEKEKDALEEAAEKLKEKNEELEALNKLMVGRELKMIELKKQLEEAIKNKK
jgi:hypothetical protein